jgi:hypothetical protein
LNHQVAEHHLRAGRDDLEDPVQELAGIDDRRIGPARSGPLDDPAVAGPGQVQIAFEPRGFVVAVRVADGQRVGAGQELDGVVGAAGIGVELEDRGAQAAAAQAAVGEGRRRDGRGNSAVLQQLQTQQAPGQCPAAAGAAPEPPQEKARCVHRVSCRFMRFPPE